MKQNDLGPAPGSKKASKRVGRGNSSGHGTYSGRGQKGQKARAGGIMRPGFEGGQLPLIKRSPKMRGFTNVFRVEYNVVNVGRLNAFDAGSEVAPEALQKAGFIGSTRRPVKVLAEGELDRALTVKAHKFSTAAKAKIEAAGGRAEEIGSAGDERAD